MARRRFGFKAELYEVVLGVREHFKPDRNAAIGQNMHF
jgi:hypothetical protein